MITHLSLGKNGEFGNQLFQIAATVSHATSNEDTFIFPKWECIISGVYYTPFFKHNINETHDPIVVDNDYGETSFTYSPIPYVPNKTTNLRGYFQSEKYFKENKSKIVELFKPSKKVEDIITIYK